MKTLFVKNLNFSISDEEIHILFSVFGDIKSFKRPLDMRTKLKQGFCFIEMEDSDADLALKALDGSELGGRVLTVELSNKTKRAESEKEEAQKKKAESKQKNEAQTKNKDNRKRYRPRRKPNNNSDEKPAPKPVASKKNGKEKD